MRIILNLVRDEDALLAVRAARWLIAEEGQKDAILCYGDSNDPPAFWVKRNKASISVHQQPFKTDKPNA